MATAGGRPTQQNGTSRASVGRLAVTDGAAAFYDDPMSRVLGLDAHSGPLAWLGYTLAAIALFLGLIVGARVVTLLLESMNPPEAAEVVPPQEIDVMKEDAPPPPPVPEATEAKPEPVAPPPAAKAVHEAPPPPAAPAQAAKVLAQEPDPNEPVDLTGNTIVQGNADAYAGGTTAANGTSARAVRTITGPEGVAGGTAPPQAKPTPSACARAASVGGTEWNAPFPPEADTAQVDEAYVTLQIDVRPDGTASAVRVLTDPGNGFGREARRYALAQHYPSAIGNDCQPIAGTVKFRVHFSR
jgi:periplasmic protein TonB